ncbi:MAG: hypothetical protein JWQ11_1938, partial [Rhizobacter sp.]|nr:hypothetical protein [Rhizobacter sp.]
AAHGGPDTELTDEVRERCAVLTKQLLANNSFAVKFFDGIVRKMKASRR